MIIKLARMITGSVLVHPTERGIIYDRNGVPLALNRTIYQLEIVPEKVANIQETLESLRGR